MAKKLNEILTLQQMNELQENGYMVVISDCPEYAVQEIRSWYSDVPDNGTVAWEALNCAINLMHNRLFVENF